LLKAAGLGAVGFAGLTAAGLTWGGAGASAPLRSLSGPRSWLNTAPVQAENLDGKVVLVNFWTYSCINSLRTLPFLREWSRKYQDRGLVVIGVHTPEFSFEHDVEKVRRAIAAEGVPYSVVLDNDYAIWSAFENQAWPGFYFVDALGFVRHHVFGEGAYDRSELFIQRLLAEAGNVVGDAVVDVAGEGAQAAPDWHNLRSPETYVGYAKASNFSPWGGLRGNTTKHYDAAPDLDLNHWSLAGAWDVGSEFATLTEPAGAIRFRFQARDLHLVLGRSPGSPAIRYRVTIDGAPPGVDGGVDVDAEGSGVLEEDRMYQLVRQRDPTRSREFEITFLDAGVRAYVFTFG
jgi:thiol-disulfide isomerase/thioredoxin